MKLFLLALSVLLLTSCGASKETASTKNIENYEATNETVYKNLPKITTAAVPDDFELIKTREFLIHGSQPDLPVFGMVIFTSKPINKEQEEQYNRICRAWEYSLLTAKQLGGDLKNKTFTTYWPVVKNVNSCNDFNNYDYAYAQLLLRDLKIKKAGPMLLAVYRNKKDIRYVNLNLNMLIDNDVLSAFNIWKFDLVVTNKGWDNSFNYAYFKEKFRTLLNSYGNALINYKFKS